MVVYNEKEYIIMGKKLKWSGEFEDMIVNDIAQTIEKYKSAPS